MKNNICLLFLFCFIVFSCKGQHKKLVVNNEKDSLKVDNYPIIKNFDCGKVSILANGKYDISFEKEGDMYIEDSAARFDDFEMTLGNFQITLDNSKIKFKEKYQFIIGKYTNINDLLISLKGNNSDEYELDILQMTKHTTIDKVYLKKTNNEYEIDKIENIQPFHGSRQVCFYDPSAVKKTKVDLLNAKMKTSDCFEEHNLKLLNGEEILILKNEGILATLKIDSIQIRESQIKAEISNNCGPGDFIFKNRRDIDLIPSKRIKDIIYSHYKTRIEPDSFVFTQGAEYFSLNMYDEKSADIFCRTNRNKTPVIANIIIFQIYTPLHNYNLLAVNDIEKIISD